MNNQDKEQLTKPQFKFVKRFDVLFTINAYHRRLTGKNDPIFQLLIESETYRTLFAGLSIDDILDLYSDTDGYVRNPFGKLLLEVIKDQLPKPTLSTSHEVGSLDVDDLKRHFGILPPKDSVE